jgi:adenine-specific DNA-methyltransferase
MNINDAQSVEKSIHIMKYMGSKRPLLGSIVPVIRKYSKEGQTILDLFAGTHSVGYSLKQHFRIFANDIQRYSLAIGKAILCNQVKMEQSPEEVCSQLIGPYRRNYSALRQALSSSIKKERDYIERYFQAANLPLFYESNQFPLLLNDYQAFLEEYPYYRSNGRFDDKNENWNQDLLALFTRWIAERKADPGEFPYALFSTYYANGYFGVHQCTVIDSLRYAVDQCFPETDESDKDQLQRNICLSAMMYAASYCVAAPGHFAQFLSFDSQRESAHRAVFHHRSQSFLERFKDKLQDIYRHLESSPYDNRCYAMDYRDLLSDDELMAEVDLVYADPPYTNVHYSRFYHILETLVRYDYPESIYIGRYRDDRHQSGFCQKSNVEDEFRYLLRNLSSMQKTLVISYPDTGLMPLSQLVALCKEYYSEPDQVVKESREQYVHSTLGGKTGNARKDVTEALIVCAKDKPIP